MTNKVVSFLLIFTVFLTTWNYHININLVFAESTNYGNVLLFENLIKHVYKLGDEMYEKSPENKKFLRQILDTTSQTFDSNGYKWIIEQVTNQKSNKRFTQALDHPRFDRPHCDRGDWVDPINGFGSLITFPGGPYRGSGFDLTTWYTLGNMFKSVGTPASANEPAGANMALQIFNQVKGLIQTIIALIVDTVPPMVIGNASIFPLCATGAAQVAQTFPICFPQCLAVLVACPGFWVDDIAGACGSNVSVPLVNNILVQMPPMCSFSAFVNHGRIPPQYTTYEASKLYPESCPKYDANLDLPLDLYNKKDNFHSSIAEAAKEKLAKMPLYEKLIKSLELHYAPKAKPCDCEKMKVKCKLHIPYPVHIKASEKVSETHYEKPEWVSEDERRCCAECKPIWETMYSVG
ncbi:conserved hypothetical protein [Theileria orientalis strain Shintoku]|uniref:Uncharacterized protein n=1 Tax=Theileria orientalis strain Shintoku TaxID=869250 RepID=J7M8E8_THEOR|nr:conserved hypothetical protein [Theileria orientalis strain Shintoku]BAM38763.1 conserved hypothetical protein [Theileria orientalis strain Shintoku]|eukprot:XP_009689064.1 conserved hypothetical protein [Theileria orientalis strain Shintoku]